MLLAHCGIFVRAQDGAVAAVASFDALRCAGDDCLAELKEAEELEANDASVSLLQRLRPGASKESRKDGHIENRAAVLLSAHQAPHPAYRPPDAGAYGPPQPAPAPGGPPGAEGHGSTCLSETTGTCLLMACDDERHAECSEGKCMCSPGLCADADGYACISGIDDEPDLCGKRTRGTCGFFGCHARRGATMCEHGQCVCAPGHCTDASKERCLPGY